MRCFQGLAFTATVLLSFTLGTEIQYRNDAPPKILSLETRRRENVNPLQHDRLRKRAGKVQVSLDNEKTLYFANITIGTPSQSLRLHIDTGSSDLWANTASSALCNTRGSPCKVSGTYSANSSSTSSYIGSYFKISYVDGSGAQGDYVSDNVNLGSATLTSLQFGIGYTSSSTAGVLGIGYPAIEVQAQTAGKKAYNNLPAALVAQSFIASSAYSLYLNDLDASTGNILFGGIDTSRFSGTLATLPIQPLDGVYAEFLVTLTAISLGGSSIASNQKLPVLLDSGTSLTYLPSAMTQLIYNAVGAEYDSTLGAGVVKCSLASSTSTLDFTFTSPTISIPMNELVIEAALTSNGRQMTFSDGSAACVFGIAPSGTSTAVLGDTFLRSAYVVFDLANNQISLAQTVFNATTSNILAIGSGSGAVPSATAVQNAASATGLGNLATGVSAATAAATASSKSAAAPLAPGDGRLGVWLGIGAVALLLAI